MKNKSLLIVTELLIMLLVFALAAALCLRIFFWADSRSRALELRDRALLLTESAAEILKNCRGDYDRAAGLLGGTLTEEGLLLAEEDGICIRISPEDAAVPLLGQARVQALSSLDGSQIFSLTVCWQEVTSHA